MAEPGELSLDDWYAQYAPLSDTQRLSVSRLSAWTSAQSGAPATEDDGAHASDPTTANLSGYLCRTLAEDSSPAQLDAKRTLDAVRTGMREIQEHADQAAEALRRIDELRDSVAYMEDSASSAMADTSALLAEQHEITEKHEALTLRLSYFSVLAQASQVLAAADAPTDAPSFRHMVQRLTLALEFMERHAHYKDAGVYKLRLVNALQRAMTLAKQAFTREGDRLLASAQMHIQEQRQIQDFAVDDAAFRPDAEGLRGAMYDAFDGLARAYAEVWSPLATLAATQPELSPLWQSVQQQWVRWRSVLLRDCVDARVVPPRDGRAAAQLERVMHGAQAFADAEARLISTLGATPAQDGILLSIERAMGERLQGWLARQLPSLALDDLADLATTLGHGAEPWRAPLVHEVHATLQKSIQHSLRTEILASRGTGPLPDPAVPGPYAPVERMQQLVVLAQRYLPPPVALDLTLKAVGACEARVRAATAALRDGRFGGDDGDAADALLFQWRQSGVLKDVVAAARAWYASTPAAHPDALAKLDAVRAREAETQARTMAEIGQFIAASLALPLQILVRQPSVTPAQAVAAWETFQQSVDVNADEKVDKLARHISRDDWAPWTQAIVVRGWIHVRRLCGRAMRHF